MADGDISAGDVAPFVSGSAGGATNPVAQTVADELRSHGLSENGIRGILANVNDESRFNPSLRHPDQPRWGGEAHFAHGLYQKGGAEWNKYSAWLQQNYPDASWTDPRLQTRFLAQNLKANYPGVWDTLHNGSPEQGAQAFVSGYLKPAAQFEYARSSKYGSGVPDINAYGAQASNEAPLSSSDQLTAALMQGQAPGGRRMEEQPGGLPPAGGGIPNLRPPMDTSALAQALMSGAFRPTNAPGTGTTLGRLGELFGGYVMAQKNHERMQDYQHALGQALVSASGDPNKVASIAAMSGQPELIKTALTSMGMPPQWGVIGKDMFGNDQFGWINPRTQTATPAQPGGAHLAPSGPMAGGGAQAGQPGQPVQPGQAQPQLTTVNSMQDLNRLIASGVTGKDLMAKLDPVTQSQLQALIEGRAAPGNVARGTPRWQMLMALAHYVDSSFNEDVYNTRAAMRKNAEAGGPDYKSIEAANSVFHHLSQLSDKAEALNNFGGAGVLNYPLNQARDAYLRADQDPRIPDFESIRDLAVKEVEKFYTASGGSAGEREAAVQHLRTASSPQQLHTVLQTVANAMTGKINEINRQWEMKMPKGTPDLNVLAPESVATMKKINERAARYQEGGSKEEKPAPAKASDPLAKAREAISNGAPREKVIERLKAHGVDPAGL
jgi:hypothetical protein